ncbi:hypothetical protein HCN44_006402 [Aphidius gifuensis]|uniref:Odorant-binding protein n=1 Tax=Aphidius gifuensis TaxID=684658 RepID=A0A834XVJ1_APHGI|nr:uncharacterized protein LOC122852285 [Aphidius gifuensis]KAF7993342.1 hypothetical protein HCN44_006402 [Aphidius gifuensis]
MNLKLLIIVCCFVVCYCDNATDIERDKNIAEGEKRLGDHIRLIIKHYQQDDPIGLPGAPIPDPMPVPDMKTSIMGGTINLQKINVYGLSKFRIEHVKSELAQMQVSVGLTIDKLDIKGTYNYQYWFTTSKGDFTVKLTEVNVQGLARLQVGNDGKLHAENIDMDLTFDTISIDFQNVDVLFSVIQGVANTLGTFIFDSIKPFILNQVNTNIRGEVNKQISQFPQYFPNSISPFDMAVAEARKQVSNMGYDPYKIKDYSQSVGIFTVTSSHTWLMGLASFYRMGDITLTMENSTVYAVVDVGTQEIEGRTHWDVSVIGGFLSRAGTVSFTVQYFRVQVKLSQPMDTRKRATLEEFNLELGNIQARINGAGTMDYVMEAGINILPNLLRYQIMDAIEGPIKRRLQDELDKIDVEKLIHEKIPEIEEHARNLQGVVPPDDNILDESVPAQPIDQSPFSDSEEDRGPS